MLDPDGKPIAGAEIFARPCDETETGLLAARQQGRVAVTDSDGRFHFNLDKSASDFASEGAPGWHLAQIAATAAGFAPSWIEARDVANTGEATFHLKRDDLPIRGALSMPRAGPSRASRSASGSSGSSRIMSIPMHCSPPAPCPKTRWRAGTASDCSARPESKFPLHSGRPAGTHGPQMKRGSLKSREWAATASPGSAFTGAASPTARSTCSSEPPRRPAIPSPGRRT